MAVIHPVILWCWIMLIGCLHFTEEITLPLPGVVAMYMGYILFLLHRIRLSQSSIPTQLEQAGEVVTEQNFLPHEKKVDLPKDKSEKEKTPPSLSSPKPSIQSKRTISSVAAQSRNSESATPRRSKIPRPNGPPKNAIAASKPSEQNLPKLHTEPIVKKTKNKVTEPIKRNENPDYKRPAARMKKSPETKEKDLKPHSKRHTTKHQIPEIHHKLEKGFFKFTLDQNGGKLVLPFLQVYFPRNCVGEQMELRIKAVRVKDAKLDKTVTLVTPAIHLSRKDKFTLVSFKYPVKLQVRPLYYVKNHAKEFKLQRTDNSVNMNWKTIKTLNFTEEQEFIEVGLRRFAGFRVVCDDSESLVPARDLFHALFVKRPTGISDPLQHNFYVLIHSSDTRACNEAHNILNSSAAETVCYKHSLPIRPPCAFIASLFCDVMTSDPESINYRIATPGETFLKTFPISLKKQNDEAIHPLQHVTLAYTACSAHPEQSIMIQFQWSVPTEVGSLCPSCSASNASGFTFNVSGERAIGQQNNYNYNNCTIQTPTPSEGSLNLPHNSSEPLFHDHPPHQILRECSLPADLHAIPPHNETNPWFRDNPSSYPSSVASTVVENVGISARNEAVPETNSGPGNRNFVIFQNSTASATETVPEDIALGNMQELPTNLSLPSPDTQAFSQCACSNSMIQNFEETVPKDVATTMTDEQNSFLSPTSKEISVTSVLSKIRNVDGRSVSASFGQYLSNAPNFREATSETVPKDISSITSLPRPAIITSAISGTKPNFDYAKNRQNIVGSGHNNSTFSSFASHSDLTGNSEETQNFQNETVPKLFGPSVLNGTSTHCLSLTSDEKNFDETVPKDISDVSEFEASPPTIHSTPMRPSNLTDSLGFVIGSESSLPSTSETTPDSGFDFDSSADGDKV